MVFDNKKPSRIGRVFDRLLRYLSESADGLGGETELHAAYALGLDVDLESAAASDVRVTPGIPRGGSAAGKLACAAHRILLNSYRNESIISLLSWQGSAQESAKKLKS